MREIRMSGLMSGDGKRGGASASVLAPILDSTHWLGRHRAASQWKPTRPFDRIRGTDHWPRVDGS
jgi:hypothetical protein